MVKNFRMMQLVIVALSIGIVGLDSSRTKFYGSDSRLCKQVVNHFLHNHVKDDLMVYHNPVFPLIN